MADFRMLGLEPVDDVSVGDWIAPRLGPFAGRVSCVVPRGYDAYARVLHPVEAADRIAPSRTWADVCRSTGRTAHALMQWTAIAGVVERLEAGSWQRSSEIPEFAPSIGTLVPQARDLLLEVLARFTEPAEDCFHAMWEGYGWLDAVFPQQLSGPRLRLPRRDHLVFRGPLVAAAAMGNQVTAEWFMPQSPTLIWPESRSWCVGTEVDFDSTLVAGPDPLIEDILAAPGLEVWRVGPEDDLSIVGDIINKEMRTDCNST